MFNPLFIKYELVECYYEGGNYPYENYKNYTFPDSQIART